LAFAIDCHDREVPAFPKPLDRLAPLGVPETDCAGGRS